MPDLQPSPVQPLAPKSVQGIYEVPLGMVGGNTYGRYNKISSAQTWNMMISDGFLVDYAGFQFIKTQKKHLKNYLKLEKKLEI